METARALAGLGYVALAATLVAAAYVGVAGAPGAVPAAADPLLTWVRSVPPAAFGAALVLALWGLWRLALPA